MTPEQSGLDIDPPRGGRVAACLQGEDGAWEQLVRGHAALVYGVIRRCGLEGQAADDLFHAVWLAIWRRLGTLVDEPCLKTWLVTQTIREVTRAQRPPCEDVNDRNEFTSG